MSIYYQLKATVAYLSDVTLKNLGKQDMKFNY